MLLCCGTLQQAVGCVRCSLDNPGFLPVIRNKWTDVQDAVGQEAGGFEDAWPWQCLCLSACLLEMRT